MEGYCVKCRAKKEIKNGQPTTNPDEVAALLPFGAHTGYGLSLMNEVVGAFSGGSLPTLRNRWDQVKQHSGEKGTCAFYFQCVRADAVSGEDFAQKRSQNDNVKAVIKDILGHGNENCMLPGQPEAQAAAQSKKHGGLLFTQAEVDAFADIAKEAGGTLDRSKLKQVEV